MFLSFCQIVIRIKGVNLCAYRRSAGCLYRLYRAGTTRLLPRLEGTGENKQSSAGSDGILLSDDPDLLAPGPSLW